MTSSLPNNSKLVEFKGKFGQPELMHLLRRSLFGVSYSDYLYFKDMGLAECLDILLTPAVQPEPPLNYYNPEVFGELNVPLGVTWVNEGFLPTADTMRRDNLKSWWVGQMMNQKRSLTEKMTLFWHNHFPTESKMIKDARVSYKHIVLLRQHALGNFKKLARAVTTDPCMLIYLNGNANIKGAPNENYGRELQELFTVGKGPDSHYTEDDVRNAARVLTGWNVAGWQDQKSNVITSFFDPDKHDVSDKQFSDFYGKHSIKGRAGADGALETDELIDMIFGQLETARYICRKLYRWFVSPTIAPEAETEVIIPLADLMFRSKFEVVPVLRALLGSQHFFNPDKYGCMIKNPADFTVGFLRQMDVKMPSANEPDLQYGSWSGINVGLNMQYMQIGDPPNVAGWPAYYEYPFYDKLWLDSFTFPQRNYITDTVASKQGLISDNYYLKFDFLQFASQFPEAENATKLLEQSVMFLNPVSIGPAQTKYLKSVLLNGGADNDVWATVWKKYKANPNDTANTDIVETRLRNVYRNLLELAAYQLM